MDFTLRRYKRLLLTLEKAGYRFVNMTELYELQQRARVAGRTISEEAGGPVCCLRHDIDKRAAYAVPMAAIENGMHIGASYYFRVVPESNQPNVMHDVVSLGHELGYHYEDLTTCQGNVEKAYESFGKNLTYFRRFYPIKTICMHGSPMSKYDSRDIWKQYDYHQYDIICEPYLDLDYSQILYLTDTGRRWDGFHVSLRDKIPVYQEQWIEQGLTFHTTQDLIRAIPSLPERGAKVLLLTTHPQRWSTTTLKYLRELIIQSTKNVIKRILVAARR